MWGRLDALDTLRKAAPLPNDAVLFATLMLGPLEEALLVDRDPMGTYESLVSDVVETLSVPRRMKERMRNVVGAQRRLAIGKLGSMMRRDYFDDAALLYGIGCDARGERRPEWLDARGTVTSELPPPRRRRRRRHR